MSTRTPEMTDRYGRPSIARRRAIIAVSGLVGVVALAWVVWAAYVQGTPQVQSSLQTYHVVDGHTARATVVVKTRSAGVHASCVLRAEAADHSVVGEVTFAVAGTGRPRHRRGDMRTDAPPRPSTWSDAPPRARNAPADNLVYLPNRPSISRSDPMTEPTPSNAVWLTQAKYDELKAELETLRGPTRASVVSRVSEARDEGDLKENAGYHAARDELGKIDGRIAQLTQMLERAKVGETPADDGVVEPGMKVTINLIDHNM